MDAIVYGYVQGAALLADIAMPATGGPLPVVISIHGGRWYYGTRRDTGSIDVEQWADLGFFAMSIDYRLVTCTPAPAPYQDTLCALRWAHAHAREYNLDRDRIFLLGMSCGGHMASLAATWARASSRKPVGGTNIRRRFGPPSVRPAPTTWSNWTGVPDGYRRASRFPMRGNTRRPSAMWRPDNSPQLILHSDDDPSIPIEQVLRMVAALEEAGAPHKFLHYKDRGHMFITEEVIEGVAEVHRRMVCLTRWSRSDTGSPLTPASIICLSRSGARGAFWIESRWRRPSSGSTG